MSRSGPQKRRRLRWIDHRGLTLLEVVVTLAILAMLGVMAAEAVRIGRRSWDQQRTGADAEQRIRAIYDTLARELASLQPVTELVDGFRVVAFEGWPDRIDFYGRPDSYQPFPFNAMVRRVSFSVQPDNGLVMQERFPLVTDESAQSRVRVVAPEVKELGFRYLLPGAEDLKDSNWRQRWVPIEFIRDVNLGARKSLAGQGVGQSATLVPGSGLPLAVEVTVTVAKLPTNERIKFVMPIAVGGYL